MHWGKLLWCKLCFAICGMPWLIPVPDGFQGQSLSRSKSVWPAYRAVLEEHRACWQREKLTWNLRSALAGASRLISFLAVQQAGRRLAHNCGTAAGKDRRTRQQGSADRGLASGLAGTVLRGEPQHAGVLPMNYLVLEWKFGGDVQPQDRVLLLLPSRSKQWPATACYGRRWGMGKASGLSPFDCSCSPGPANQDNYTRLVVCFPSSIPLASVLKHQLGMAALAPSHAKLYLGWECLGSDCRSCKFIEGCEHVACCKVGPSLEVPVSPLLGSSQKSKTQARIWGKEASICSPGAGPPTDITFAASFIVFVILLCLAMIFYVWHYFNNTNKKGEKISW